MTAGVIRNPECPTRTALALEHVLCCFIEGYNLALASTSDAALANDLDHAFDAHHVGFAYEGAGTALALLDLLTLNRSRRLRSFITGAGAQHDYIIMVGAGLGAARAHWLNPFWRRYFSGFDPLVSWCVPDGFGFYQGIFHPQLYADTQRLAPAFMSAPEAQLFDSGIGRSLWWSCGADAERIAEKIAAFPAARRGEMWCGIGVACAYAGGDDGESLPALLDLAGDYRPDFLSGVPFAARMRQKAHNASCVTDHCCRFTLGRSVEEAASMACEQLHDAARILGERVGREGYAMVRRHLSELLTAPTGVQISRAV